MIDEKRIVVVFLTGCVKCGWELEFFSFPRYGGHITDFWDRRVNNTYLAVLIIPDLMSGAMNLAPGFKSPDSSKIDYAGYIKYML